MLEDHQACLLAHFQTGFDGKDGETYVGERLKIVSSIYEDFFKFVLQMRKAWTQSLYERGCKNWKAAM